MIQIAAGYSATLHDSTVMVWSEKLRHDLVRPTSIIKYVFGDELVMASGHLGKVATKIKASEFQPYVRTMPHSEFPSGSACICEAIADYFRQVQGGKDKLEPPFSVVFLKGSSPIEPGIVPSKDTVVLFHSLSEISRTCAQSRLWGGMHFSPSPPASVKLCSGIGKIAYAFVESKATKPI
eukprot:TRINITY_DN10288_c1_g1_i4.p2 TRINITY_DN10288_c1_g1~~TRINITY_DN10288_c1_g1_i4.p2  ORF type:complete len:180 (-),score=17.18 TRINITY_DN10288_c1_g1_i4:418-957(-)